MLGFPHCYTIVPLFITGNKITTIKDEKTHTQKGQALYFRLRKISKDLKNELQVIKYTKIIQSCLVLIQLYIVATFRN